METKKPFFNSVEQPFVLRFFFLQNVQKIQSGILGTEGLEKDPTKGKLFSRK